MTTKGWLLAVALMGLLIVSASGAQAQLYRYPTPEEFGLNYEIHAGAVFPINGDVNTTTSFLVGISWYDELGQEFGDGSTLGLSGDWTTIERFDGTNVSLVPVMVNYKRYGLIGNYRVFGLLGIGIIATTDDIPEMQMKSGANFGWNGGLGVDIDNNIFFQARFFGSDKPADDGFVSVELGYRF